MGFETGAEVSTGDTKIKMSMTERIPKIESLKTLQFSCLGLHLQFIQSLSAAFTIHVLCCTSIVVRSGRKLHEERADRNAQPIPGIPAAIASQKLMIFNFLWRLMTATSHNNHFMADNNRCRHRTGSVVT